MLKDLRLLRTEATGRVAAVVEGGFLVRRAVASRHFLRKPPAIAFDVSILGEARAAGAHTVRVLELESGCEYTAALGDFERFGFDVDRGFGRQRALPLGRWQVRRPGEAVQPRLL